MAIADVLERLATNWAKPKPAMHRGEETVAHFRCRVESGPAEGDSGMSLPDAVAQYWDACAGAFLFEDSDFGGWGLELMSPDGAVSATAHLGEERPDECLTGDLVLGRFLSDGDLLVVRCDPEAKDFGAVLVALPLDGRGGWHRVAPDLEAFISEYELSEGAKFWEMGNFVAPTPSKRVPSDTTEIHLPRAEALVLFGWLARRNNDRSFHYDDVSEQHVVHKLQELLAEHLPDVESPEYANELKKARTALSPTT
jgi:hypothetical protein